MEDFPKTHSFEKLFKEAAKVCEKLEEFYKRNILTLKAIYDAYFQIRYFPTKYSKEEVEEMLRVLEKFKETIRECL